jgi:hypothetical protein
MSNVIDWIQLVTGLYLCHCPGKGTSKQTFMEVRLSRRIGWKFLRSNFGPPNAYIERRTRNVPNCNDPQTWLLLYQAGRSASTPGAYDTACSLHSRSEQGVGLTALTL